MPVGTLYISPDWYKTDDGRDKMSVLFHNNKLHAFGLLEKPKISFGASSFFEYKLFLSGKSNVGKTCLAAKLSGNTAPTEHWPTAGIQVSTVYWPVQHLESRQVMLFKLQLWDVGSAAIRKFSHLLPACQKNADGVIFVFSSTDRSSFTDLNDQMTRALPEMDICKFLAVTKLDKSDQTEVSRTELDSYESNSGMKIFSVPNILKTSVSVSDLDNIAPLMNHICDQLWIRYHVTSDSS